jgi:hypothetical protein
MNFVFGLAEWIRQTGREFSSNDDLSTAMVEAAYLMEDRRLMIADAPIWSTQDILEAGTRCKRTQGLHLLVIDDVDAIDDGLVMGENQPPGPGLPLQAPSTNISTQSFFTGLGSSRPMSCPFKNGFDQTTAAPTVTR